MFCFILVYEEPRLEVMVFTDFLIDDIKTGEGA